MDYRRIRHLWIAVDFDGMLVRERWPEVGEEMPGALEALRNFHADLHYLVLNTCRKGDLLREAAAWLKHRGVYGLFESVNRNSRRRCAMFGGVDVRKISADVYLDDRNIPPVPRMANGDVNWRVIERMVQAEAERDVA